MCDVLLRHNQMDCAGDCDKGCICNYTYTFCYMSTGGVDVVFIKHVVGGNYAHGGALNAAQYHNVIPRAKHTQQTKCVVYGGTTRSFSNVIVVCECVNHHL